MYEGDKNAEISKEKAVTTSFNALQQLFWLHLYGEDPLNSVVSTTTTHREPRKIFDGTGTQVKAEIVDKCAIKMA